MVYVAGTGNTGWRLWDVRGGFGNSRLEIVKERIIRKSKKNMEAMGDVHRGLLQGAGFEVEWDGKIRRKGRSKVSMPKGSP